MGLMLTILILLHFIINGIMTALFINNCIKDGTMRTDTYEPYLVFIIGLFFADMVAWYVVCKTLIDDE